MPYIASWNQAPVRDGREDWWLHLQLFSFRRAPGKLKYLAGSESGHGRVHHRHQPGGRRRAAARGGGRNEQTSRDGRARSFTERFGTAPEGVWAAPGRVNVIGEHTDYNGGFVLPVALPHTTRAALARRDDGAGRVRIAAGRRRGRRVRPGRAGARSPAAGRGYPAGVVHGPPRPAAGGGASLVDGDVPVGAGLSSSAALDLLRRAGAARPVRRRS